MDVRKWCHDKAVAAGTGRPDIVADAFTPAITKLVEALQAVAIGLHELDGTIDHDEEFEKCDEWHCAKARAALTELEKP